MRGLLLILLLMGACPAQERPSPGPQTPLAKLLTLRKDLQKTGAPQAERDALDERILKEFPDSDAAFIIFKMILIRLNGLPETPHHR